MQKINITAWNVLYLQPNSWLNISKKYLTNYLVVNITKKLPKKILKNNADLDVKGSSNRGLNVCEAITE